MKVSAAVVCLVLVAGFCLVPSSAYPSSNTILNSCLTPSQIKTLKEAIVGIQVTLNTAVISLDIAAAAEKDPNTKKDLEEAATVIKDVSVYLVANLTKIAESACGNCSQIVAVVNETVAVIEETLENIDPSWRNNTIFEVVVTVVDDILAIVELVCPNKVTPPEYISARPVHLRDSCLNATQLKELEKVTAAIQLTLTTAEVALEIAAKAESDPNVKKDLEEAVVIIKAISQDLVANLTTLLRAPCATCENITNIVAEAIQDIEAALTQINPNWPNDPLWESIVSAINDIIGYIRILCPDSAARVAVSHHMSRSMEVLHFVRSLNKNPLV